MSVSPTGLSERIKALAKERNAVILAHNYERPEVQDVADFVGDSLGLSREAAKTTADVIVFCGVHFMAETAAILSPTKTVLLPDLAAGCSLADTITADQLRAWKAEHPGAVVVSYVNTTAAVKAESDYCCTSGNASEIVNSIPADKEILFLPDLFLGAHVRRVTGRENIRVWLGECHVHAGITPLSLARQRSEHECGTAGAPRVRMRDKRRRGNVSGGSFRVTGAGPLDRGNDPSRPNRRTRSSSSPPRQEGSSTGSGARIGQDVFRGLGQGRVPVHEDDDSAQGATRSRSCVVTVPADVAAQAHGWPWSVWSRSAETHQGSWRESPVSIPESNLR